MQFPQRIPQSIKAAATLKPKAATASSREPKEMTKARSRLSLLPSTDLECWCVKKPRQVTGAEVAIGRSEARTANSNYNPSMASQAIALVSHPARD